MVEPLSLTAADGVVLEGERARPPGDAPVRAGMVLCHPHPQFGGTMRSIVISALFEAMPAIGVECVRFNFRGVEGSGGSYSEGEHERLDAQAAIAELAPALPPGAPLLLAGWSFGADMTLATADTRIAAWIGIAPPLRFRTDFDAVGHDARPKLLVLGQHDEFRDPASVVDATESWETTEIDVIAGASHFFVGRTDRVVDAVRAFVERVVSDS